MKAKIQRIIGLVTAAIMAIVGFYELLFLSHSTASLLGLLETTVFSAIYFFALKTNKLTLAATIYRAWWVIGLVLLSVFFICLLIAGELAQIFQDFFIVFLSGGLFFGLITFLWWVGLIGLKQIIEADKKPKDGQSSK